VAPFDDRADRAARLTGLLEVTRLVRSEQALESLLPAVAAAISEAMGFGTVVISVHRPATDDFRVEVVHGSDAAAALLLGREPTWEDWRPIFDERFERHGCYLLPWDEYDWSPDSAVSFVPDLAILDGPDAWHPEDGLFVPLRHSDGDLLGVLSVDEPASGRRPSDDALRVLGALAAHAAQAIQDAQAAAVDASHRTALEHLLRVSAQLTETLSVDAVLQSVCEGIAAALGFAKVSVELVDPATGRTAPRAVVGYGAEELRACCADAACLARALDPAFEIEGCYVLPDAVVRSRTGVQRPGDARRGRGPHGWDDHRLVIPLIDGAGHLVGAIWADEPADRLLPTTERLQALRLFANQATTAVASAAAYEEMRFLADHDPLTRLGNRRAFTRRLAEEVHRAVRYGRHFALVVTDIDGFKELNDRHGHQAGDAALLAIGDVLTDTLRRSDCAFRLGGDEFALLLEESGVGEATMVVERVAEGIAGVVAGEGHTLRASFGIALADTTTDPETLLRAADAAMYEAKRAGAGVRVASG
jgi:diguanylate cyclase (GGDEF)-like protein